MLIILIRLRDVFKIALDAFLDLNFYIKKSRNSARMFLIHEQTLMFIKKTFA